MKKYIIRKKYYCYNDEGFELILPTELIAVLQDKETATAMKIKLEKEAYITHLNQIISLSDYPFTHGGNNWKIIEDFKEKYSLFATTFDEINNTSWTKKNFTKPFENETQLEEFIKEIGHDFYILEEATVEKLHYTVVRNDDFWKEYEVFDIASIYRFGYDQLFTSINSFNKLSFKTYDEALHFAYCETINYLPYQKANFDSDFPDLLKHFYKNAKYIKLDEADDDIQFMLSFDYNMSIFEDRNTFQPLSDTENQAIIEELNTWYSLLKTKPFTIVEMNEEEFVEYQMKL